MNKMMTETVELEPYRPLYHFSPREFWLNDPNGLVYVDGVYHLCYQYNPSESVWGNMHWGHASSRDLLEWEHHEPALFPGEGDDEFVFSGSCVHDCRNESGLGTAERGPLLAFYTLSDESGGAQRQCLSYSNDNGESWQAYADNPLVPNGGRPDFRDPKVIWFAPGSCWIMVIAAGQEVLFYRSTDLRNWTASGAFGHRFGAHGGCWECPDLFELQAGNSSRWVLLISINPGAPNGGSATQYFVGAFDGQHFYPEHRDIRWLDWGPDCFAAVTWEAAKGVPLDRVCIGWMSNWLYADRVPTSPWRGQMTLPRTLRLLPRNDQWMLASKAAAVPAPRGTAQDFDTLLNEISPSVLARISDAVALDIELRVDSPDCSAGVWLHNEAGERVELLWERATGRLIVNRSELAPVPGLRDFAFSYYAMLPHHAATNLKLQIFVDRCSIEVFASDGEVVMSVLVFPKDEFSLLSGFVEGEVDVQFCGRVQQLQTLPQ